MVPACKKSNITPKDSIATVTGDNQRLMQQDAVGTSLYVMLASKPCVTPQKEYTSLTVDIKGVRVYSLENGWQTLPVTATGLDLVSMQQENMPSLNLTDRIMVQAGTITKVAINFGVNNKLVVNNKPESCLKLGTQEVILDLKGEVKKDAVNELLVSMDICGNITAQTGNDGNRCYLLNPSMKFERVSQKMIK